MKVKLQILYSVLPIEVEINHEKKELYVNDEVINTYKERGIGYADLQSKINTDLMQMELIKSAYKLKHIGILINKK